MEQLDIEDSLFSIKLLNKPLPSERAYYDDNVCVGMINDKWDLTKKQNK